jgi:hypothetical protein
VGDAEELRAVGVRVAVIPDQNAVGFLRAGHDVMEADAEMPGEVLRCDVCIR